LLTSLRRTRFFIAVPQAILNLAPFSHFSVANSLSFGCSLRSFQGHPRRCPRQYRPSSIHTQLVLGMTLNCSKCGPTLPRCWLSYSPATDPGNGGEEGATIAANPMGVPCCGAPRTLWMSEMEGVDGRWTRGGGGVDGPSNYVRWQHCVRPHQPS
jgi:hypothetical protein